VRRRLTEVPVMAWPPVSEPGSALDLFEVRVYRMVELWWIGRNSMSLNIKDPEAHRLAQKIAEATGETMTRVVISSLRERLERLHLHRRDPDTLAADIRSIAKRASAEFNKPHIDHGKFLYDEQGLPR
jgi:antitoxin VapB